MFDRYDRSVLILGGARSGKSTLAQKMAQNSSLPFVYLATGIVTDDEMESRVKKHQSSRPPTWTTLETPLGFRHIEADLTGKGVLLDCITFLTSNLLLQEKDENATFQRLTDELQWLLEKRDRERFFCLMVSNETGMGVVPEYPLGRTFRDLQGRINQWLAVRADEVYLVVAGLPWKLKGRVEE